MRQAGLAQIAGRVLSGGPARQQVLQVIDVVYIQCNARGLKHSNRVARALGPGLMGIGTAGTEAKLRADIGGEK